VEERANREDDTQMRTGMLLSYKLSRWKLALVYVAIIPLLLFALRELVMYGPPHGRWEYLLRGVIVVSALMAAVHLYRKWMRFVTEMHCTEMGIHVNTVLCGNLDISWIRVGRLRHFSSVFGSEFVALDIADEPPVFMYLDEVTRDKLIALLGKSSSAVVEASQ
jgi:hypothetical protein